MATDADKTPVDNPRLTPMDQLLVKLSILESGFGKVETALSHLEEIKVGVQRTANAQIQMHAHQQREGHRLRFAIGTCVVCALLCVVCTALTYSTVARAAMKTECSPASRP